MNALAYPYVVKNYWAPRPEVVAYVEKLVPSGARVLEIGPGHVPFSKATHFIDRFDRPGLQNVTRLDVIKNPLPFPDDFFDFIYCRHVVEDLALPDLLLTEMSRVGKAGYIETPSPAAELTRGVDGGGPPYRGYVHHRWIVYATPSRLHLIEKGNVIEHLDLSPVETSKPLERPLAWNTYLIWNGSFGFNRYEHDIHFSLHVNYRKVLLDAYEAGLQNETEIGALLAK